jgi:membrane fusion protein (multidrug efflux system)
MKHNYLIIPWLIAIVITFISCGKPAKSDSEITGKPIPVELQMVKKADYHMGISYSGTIEESESIPLSFSTLGTVTRVFVSEGDSVKKGDLLAEINSEIYNNAYRSAMAALRQAEDAYKRMYPIYKNGNLPEIKLVEIETGLEQAKSATAITKKNLDDCKLYSPADGIVGSRSIEAAMAINSITIVKIDKVYAKISIPENEIAKIAKGTGAKIIIPAIGETPYSGIVSEVGVMADPVSRSYKARILINNDRRIIKPGMICNVVLKTQDIINSLVIPAQSIMVDEKGENFVYIADMKNGIAIKRSVIIGRLLNNGIAIKKGLNPGDYVIINGQHKLADSDLISVNKKI